MTIFTTYEGGGILSVDGDPVVTFDAVESIGESLDTEATEYPIERGSDVLDSAVRRPLDVRFVGHVTATPFDVTDETTVDRDRVAWDALRALWMSGSPVTFATAGDVWENMRIVSVQRDRGPGSPHLLTVAVEMRQIIVATLERVEVPVQFIQPQQRPGATRETDAGRQPTTAAEGANGEAAEKRRSSMLRQLIRGE